MWWKSKGIERSIEANIFRQLFHYKSNVMLHKHYDPQCYWHFKNVQLQIFTLTLRRKKKDALYGKRGLYIQRKMHIWKKRKTKQIERSLEANAFQWQTFYVAKNITALQDLKVDNKKWKLEGLLHNATFSMCHSQTAAN